MRNIPEMFKTSLRKYSSRSDFSEYLIAFLVIGAAAAICFPFRLVLGTFSVGLILLMVVALMALVLGRWPLLFAAILNVMVWDYFFQEPLFTIAVHHLEDLFANIADLLVAFVFVILITRVRKSQTVLRNSQERLTILYNFLKSMNDAKSISDVVQISGSGLKQYFGQEAIIYLKDKDSRRLADIPYGNSGLHNPAGFLKAGDLFFKASTGNAGDIKSDAEGITFFPLRDPRDTIGIIGIATNESLNSDEDKIILFNSFITIIASTLVREITIEKDIEKGLLEHSEKLFQAVLNSVSHELRTPIAIIAAAVDNLKHTRTSSGTEKRDQICAELDSASNRLNNLVENILDMSRIESGLLKLNLQICDIADLVGSVAMDLKTELKHHRLNISIPENLSLIRADVSLLRQVLLNLLRNAIMYTPAGTAIEIFAGNDSTDAVSVTIKDNGPGVPECNLDRLFEKFYRVPGSKSGGTGLGLAIVRAFVEAHGGIIRASNDPLGGLKITMKFKSGI